MSQSQMSQSRKSKKLMKSNRPGDLSFFDIRSYWSIMDLANFRSLRLNIKY